MMKHRERIFSCTTVTLRVNYAGRTVPMRVLITDNGPFEPLMTYFKIKGLGLGSQKNAAQALALLTDYLSAHSWLQTSKTRHLALGAFSSALYRGTVDQDGQDLANLFWPPISRDRAFTLLNAVLGFLDWLSDPLNATSTIASPGTIGFTRVLIAHRRHEKMKARSMMAHMLSKQAEPRRSEHGFGPAYKMMSTPPAFPEHMIWALLQQGFGMPETALGQTVDWNVRDTAITVLLEGSGLRLSEIMHLWVDDVIEDPSNPGHAIVRIFHPADGLAPGLICPLTYKTLKLNRREYLQRVYKMAPRTETIGTFRSGWKDPALDDPNGAAFLPVFWFPPHWAKLFLTLWRVYIQSVRPAICRHPFAWVNLNKRHLGLPLTQNSYYRSRRRAVVRAGLDHCKRDGTTAHGHRHAYGRRLVKAKVGTALIQRCMHHKSPFSQHIYTTPGIDDTNEALSAALDDLAGGGRLERSEPLIRPYNFLDVDPEGLFNV